jgi:hypothetical protein
MTKEGERVRREQRRSRAYWFFVGGRKGERGKGKAKEEWMM